MVVVHSYARVESVAVAAMGVQRATIVGRSQRVDAGESGKGCRGHVT